MRCKKRIRRITKLLEDRWVLVPDQRLGQFLQNYVFGRGDIFFQEDTETEEALEGMVFEAK